MNLKTLIFIFSLAAAVAIAGCTGAPAEEKTAEVPAPEAPETPEAVVTPAEPTQTEAAAPQPAGTECNVNTDCDDKQRCTTDSCRAGVCKHVTEADCEIKVEEKPRITAANFGARADEYVQIEGKNWLMENWYVTNSKGEVFIKFAVTADLSNKINGKWVIYTRCDIPLGNDRYACKDNEFFADSGDKAVLKDDSGAIVSQYP